MDLISRQALRDAMYHEAFETDTEMQRWDSGCWIRYKLFENVIDNLPSAEQKRGKWIDGLDVPKEERERHPYVYLHGEKYCSVCYKEAYFDSDYGQQLFDYCPNCGADMREEE